MWLSKALHATGNTRCQDVRGYGRCVMVLLPVCQCGTDRRKFDCKEKENLCLRVVRRIDAGVHWIDLAWDLCMDRLRVYRWLEPYHYGGEDALTSDTADTCC